MGKRATLFVAAATLVAILAVLPWSGWLVRLQLRVAAGGSLPNWAAGRNPTGEERERERRTAEAHPGDFPLQLAAAFESRPGIYPESGTGIAKVDTTGETPNTKAARELWGKRDRFANDPSLYANLLRLLTADAVRIARETETAELEPKTDTKTPVYRSTSSRPQNTPEYLAWFDEAAATGERLEPSNGYFPAMRAIGLFAAHRDDDALAAIHRAAGKTEWNEYSQDEVRGNWRLMTLTYGEPGSFARLGQMAILLFPHYAPLRNAARLATVQAVHRELKGDTAGGFSVRHDIARLGALMRTRGTYLIGTAVGSSIVKMAQLRPGGVPAPERRIRSDEDVKNNEVAYCAYLERIGEPQEAAFVRAEGESAKRLADIRRLGEEPTLQVYSLGSLVPTAGMWIAGSALLTSVLLILLFGAACLALQRSRHLTRPWAMPVVVSLSLVVLGGSTVSAGCNFVYPWDKWINTIYGVSSGNQLTTLALQWNWSTLQLLLPPAIAMIALSLPLLMIGIASRQSRRQTVPRAIGFVRGIVSLTLPIATALLVWYAVAAVATLRLESVRRAEVEQTLSNENLYLANRSHQTLPGFTVGQIISDSNKDHAGK